MNREHAENYLRLLAEAELRRAASASGSAGQRHAQRLFLAAQALTAVDAIEVDTAEQIQADIGLALTGRRSSRGATGAFRAAGLGMGHPLAVPQRTSWRVAPVGKVIRIRDGGDHRKLLVVAYVQTAEGTRFTMAGWPFRRFTATDDRGASYQVGFRGGHAGSRGDLLGESDEPDGFRIRVGKVEGRRHRAAQPVRDLGQFVLAGHPAGGQLADAPGAVPVGQDRGGDPFGDHRAPLRYRVQFLRGQGVGASQVRGVRPCPGQALALEFGCGLACERDQPTQQLVQEVEAAAARCRAMVTTGGPSEGTRSASARSSAAIFTAARRWPRGRR
jgi:hypothetical protein